MLNFPLRSLDKEKKEAEEEATWKQLHCFT